MPFAVGMENGSLSCLAEMLELGIKGWSFTVRQEKNGLISSYMPFFPVCRSALLDVLLGGRKLSCAEFG